MQNTRIYNFRFWIGLTDETELKAVLENALSEAEYGIVGFCEHHFSPQGYTCTWLLSESHCALHTFPEEERSYVEISGCSEEKSAKFQSSIFNLWKDYISAYDQAIS